MNVHLHMSMMIIVLDRGCGDNKAEGLASQEAVGVDMVFLPTSDLMYPPVRAPSAFSAPRDGDSLSFLSA